MSEEQRQQLYELQVADFIALEWTLYMHTHSDDEQARAQWAAATNKANAKRTSYDATYGPLMGGTLQCTSQTPWPWQM